MGGRGVALVSIAALTTGVMSGGAFAQPKGLKHPGGALEIEPATCGSGSAADSTSSACNGGAPAGVGGEGTPPAASVKDPKIAKKWLLAAQQLVQKASYLAARRPDEAKAQLEEAVIAYQKALSAGADANVYADLASVEERLGKIDEAVKYLRTIVNTKAGVRPDVAKRATGKLDELSAKVGLVTLTVAPAGASITLGGVEIGMSPLPEPLVLMPGTYTLSFQADGFQPKEAEIKIEPGSETERAIELDPVKVIVRPVMPAVLGEAVQNDQPESPSRLPLYVGAGVVGAGLLGAGSFGILAVSQHAKFTAASTSKLDRADARIAGQRFALITDLSLGAAVAAAGFTAYWYFTKYKQHPRKQPRQQEERHPSPVTLTGAAPRPTGKSTRRDVIETKLDVVPWVQSQSGGMMIAGWF